MECWLCLKYIPLGTKYSTLKWAFMYDSASRNVLIILSNALPLPAALYALIHRLRVGFLLCQLEEIIRNACMKGDVIVITCHLINSILFSICISSSTHAILSLEVAFHQRPLLFTIWMYEWMNSAWKCNPFYFCNLRLTLSIRHWVDPEMWAW